MSTRWESWKPRLLELFLISNYAFLVVDIFTAHSVNQFHHWAEWIPLGFSAIAAVALIATLSRAGSPGWRVTGQVVGYASVAVGIAGLFWHLDSQFFGRQTIESLVYTAPFVAPLAYTGLGLLLLLSRMESPSDVMFGRWIIFLALGGFLGNLTLSLCDHAQNGFYHPTEWVPVIASAYGVGFLALALFSNAPGFMKATLGILLVQVIVGLWGFALHLLADVNGISSSVYENFVYGAPVFAPLLFVNLALLAMIGVYDVWAHQRGVA